MTKEFVFKPIQFPAKSLIIIVTLISFKQRVQMDRPSFLADRFPR